MNTAVRTTGLVTSLQINVRSTHPIKKAPLLFIRPTATILWTVTSMCAVPPTSILNRKRYFKGLRLHEDTGADEDFMN